VELYCSIAGDLPEETHDSDTIETVQLFRCRIKIRLKFQNMQFESRKTNVFFSFKLNTDIFIGKIYYIIGMLIS